MPANEAAIDKFLSHQTLETSFREIQPHRKEAKWDKELGGGRERERDSEFAYICSHLQALLYHVAHLLADLSEQEPMINA